MRNNFVRQRTTKHNRTWLHNTLFIACVRLLAEHTSQEILIKLYHLLLFHFDSCASVCRFFFRFLLMIFHLFASSNFFSTVSNVSFIFFSRFHIASKIYSLHFYDYRDEADKCWKTHVFPRSFSVSLLYV